MKVFTLSPSEFAFGFEGCKKCYYDKIVNNLKYASFFPPVFSLLDICQKKYYQGKSSKSISENLDEGVVITENSDRIIKSETLYDNKNIEEAVSQLRPPVFWKDKPKLVMQKRLWNLNKLNIALGLTYDVEIKFKTNSNIDNKIILKMKLKKILLI